MMCLRTLVVIFDINFLEFLRIVQNVHFGKLGIFDVHFGPKYSILMMFFSYEYFDLLVFFRNVFH